MLRDAIHISTIDIIIFFYQWNVKKEHRYRLTVASHRKQETFKVPVMGFKNSPAYVQRLIDEILRPQRAYCRAYIDNIMIFSNSLDEHITHLDSVFKILNVRNLQINPKKSYLGYPSAKLLGQRVNVLGLAIADEKFAATSQLQFLRNLT